MADSGGRYIILHIEIQGSPYVILNYYAPNVENEQLRLLNKLSDELDKLPLRENQDVHFVFGGDWNLIFDKSLDALSGKPTLKKNAIVKLKSLMGKLELVDIWRLQNPALKTFTWKSSNPFKMRRLDFFLISDDMQCNVKSCEILHGIQSDHSLVLLKISSIPESQRGPLYWKFNNSLLTDSNFVDSMRALINELISHHETENDIRVFWEFLKYKVRHFAKEYSIKNKKKGMLE